MVDFAKLNADWYASLSPEEKVRVDAHREKERAAEATAVEIQGEFARYASNDGGKTSYVIKTWTRPVKMRIETAKGMDGQPYEILAFVGAVTGHERFRLDDIREWIGKEPAGEEWAICGGSLRYDSCHVKVDDVLNYLRDIRPGMFAPAPAVP